MFGGLDAMHPIAERVAAVASDAFDDRLGERAITYREQWGAAHHRLNARAGEGLDKGCGHEHATGVVNQVGAGAAMHGANVLDIEAMVFWARIAVNVTHHLFLKVALAGEHEPRWDLFGFFAAFGKLADDGRDGGHEMVVMRSGGDGWRRRDRWMAMEG